jgi:hypothetical protein
MRRQQLTKVAEECGISHLCTRLNVDFDECVEEWKEKYLGVKTARAEMRFGKQSGSEDGPVGMQIPAISGDFNLYDIVASKIPMKLVGVDVPFVDTTYGDIDMIFERTINGKSYVLVVEVKHSTRKSSRHKGVQQVLKNVRALRELVPKKSYVGIVITLDRTKCVVKNMHDVTEWRFLFRRYADTDVGQTILSEPFLYI